MRNRVTQALSYRGSGTCLSRRTVRSGRLIHPDWVQKDPLNIEATRPYGTPVYTFQQLQIDQSSRL